MKRLVSGALFVALVAVLAAGCGGGGSKTLSKEEYGTQLNTICADYNAKTEEIGEPDSLESLATKGPELLGEFDKAIAKAEDLKAPDELADAADEFVAKGKELRDLITEVVDAAKENDAAKVQELGAKGDALDKESDALADQLGAPACKE